MRLLYLISRSRNRWKLWEGHSLLHKAKYLHMLVAPHLLSRGVHLDLGCGDGEILSEFRESSAVQVGLDLDTARLVRCRRTGLPVVRADLRGALPIADARIDVITLTSMLEHVENPHELVAEMSRVLAPSGVVVVQIPNPRFVVDLHYFLPLYGWVPERFRDTYRALLKGHDAGIRYYTNSIGKKEVLALFREFDVLLARGFFYPKEVAPHWARPFHGMFVASGLARAFPTGYLFVFRKRASAT